MLVLCWCRGVCVHATCAELCVVVWLVGCARVMCVMWWWCGVCVVCGCIVIVLCV